MRHLSLALALLLLAGCSSSSDYNQPPDRQPMRGGRMRDAGPMLLDMIPDDTWWRDNALAAPLNLTSDQFVSLDRIADNQRDEIARLDRDLPVATRDLRNAMNADPASAADITSAANRLRDIRNSLFDHQLQMVSAERLVLTQRQWSLLVEQLQREREQQRMNRGNDGGYGGRGRGGRGGYPRGGIGRPWPY
jgi:Spy/CpxP family protein refolding chaperone